MMVWKDYHYWFRGALIGIALFVLLAIYIWVSSSISSNCFYEPSQLLSPGGANCPFNGHFQNYFSLWTLIYFIVFIIPGFIIGAIIGGVAGFTKKRKRKNEFKKIHE